MEAATATPQWVEASRASARVRGDGAQVKRELKAGTLTFEQALTDPRAQRMRVEQLVLGVPRWGRERLNAVTRIAAGPPWRLPYGFVVKRVGELAPGQRAALVKLIR